MSGESIVWEMIRVVLSSALIVAIFKKKFDEILEERKGEIKRVTEERLIKYSKLHQERAEVVKDLYLIMSEVGRVLEWYVEEVEYNINYEGDEFGEGFCREQKEIFKKIKMGEREGDWLKYISEEKKEDIEWRYGEERKRLFERYEGELERLMEKFDDCLFRNKIFFKEETVMDIEQMRKGIEITIKFCNKTDRRDKVWNGKSIENVEKWGGEVERISECLEKEFREMLGVI